MARFRLRTLGGLALTRCDPPSDEATLANSKALLIVAILATRPGYTARRVNLAELLWPDADRPRALRALRQAVFFLSRHADEMLLRDEETIALNVAALEVDLWEFDHAVAEADHARVLELHAGPFAAGLERKVGVEVEHWIEAVNARLSVALEVAYTREIARAAADDDAERALRLARAFAALNPLDEERQRLLARALLSQGDRVGALQTLEEYRKLASTEADEEPSPELDERLRAMREELLHEPLPMPVQAAAPAPSEPRISQPVFMIRDYPVTRTRLFVAGGAVLVVLITLLALPRGGSPTAADPFAGLQGRLLAVVRDGSQTGVVELVVDATTVGRAERKDLQAGDVPSPDGRAVAGTVRAPDGWNVALRSGSGEPRVITTRVGDEFPVDWSPDGRYLLYAERRLLQDSRTQAYALAVYDLARGTSRELSTLTSTDPPAAAWSPDGTRIVFTANPQGAPGIFVVQFDGAGLRDLSRHAGWDGDPAWSPDGGRIAFVSSRGGGVDLYTMRADGSDVVRLTRTDAPESRPVWLSPTVLAFLVGPERDRTLRMLETFTDQVRDLDRTDRFLTLLAPRDRRPAWIERLAIAPRVELGSPGQYIDFRVAILDPGGDTLPDDDLPIAWRVTDRQVARLEGPGRLQVLSPGHTVIIADAAGWRADTLGLLSVPLVQRPATPTFVETWRHGLDTTRWHPFGDPAPLARPTGGPGGSGTFLSNGDAFFASGAVTDSAFPLKDGLGVEVDGRMAFTGRLHQEFGLALYTEQLPDSVLASGQAPALAELRVRGPTADAPGQAWISTPEWRQDIAMPEQPAAWHAYALQIDADGAVELVVDGRLHWRSPVPLKRHGGSARVGLGFESLETEILHGRLRVYTPPRYTLPQLTVEAKQPSHP